MSVKAILQGKPLGIPLHVAIVHFPIALFAFSTALDIAGFAGAGNALNRAAFYTLALGLIGAALAAIPGLADYSTIRSDHPARATATWHLTLNVTAVILYIVSFCLRWNHLNVPRAPLIPFIVSIFGVILILVSAYLGGILVYDDGIGVGRHRRTTPLPQRTLTLDAPTDPGDFIAVADADSLAEGQTLRANVGGTLMTFARVDGEVHAFQEFCTHRCGPLSEGTFQDGQVRCPWHNSRFDLRTGKVTHGPAKLDLRVFETAIRQGRICVRVLIPKPGGLSTDFPDSE